jgi:hypothetical protein
VGLREKTETNNDESGLQYNCLLLKKKRSFSLINRMPEIIDINKHLSYRKRKEKRKGVWYTHQSLSFLDRSLISVGVFNYYLPLVCA